MKKTAPTPAYNQKRSKEELHQESRNWLSTIEFWKQDFAFMLHLVEEHFFYFLAKDKEHTLQPLLVKINNLNQRVLDTEVDRIEGHEAELAVIIKSLYFKDETAYRQQHEILTEEMSELESTYRMLKAELFRFAKEVIKDEKFKSLKEAIA